MTERNRTISVTGYTSGKATSGWLFLFKNMPVIVHYKIYNPFYKLSACISKKQLFSNNKNIEFRAIHPTQFTIPVVL
jgi:hypothetical protein